ncbi:hypothetical protein B0H16DRAFT_1592700 [Mycena metata]|uniref:Uncharacterized protein n=1 Tax=Mycena metata TaxID=1033252 RepID=A0AAD7MP18_9AGAR|nr:hypothetical protein B0H16DRAFT_1592700 [Mycena metata]
MGVRRVPSRNGHRMQTPRLRCSRWSSHRGSSRAQHWCLRRMAPRISGQIDAGRGYPTIDGAQSVILSVGRLLTILSSTATSCAMKDGNLGSAHSFILHRDAARWSRRQSWTYLHTAPFCLYPLYKVLSLDGAFCTCQELGVLFSRSCKPWRTEPFAPPSRSSRIAMPVRIR